MSHATKQCDSIKLHVNHDEFDKKRIIDCKFHKHMRLIFSDLNVNES